MLLNAHFDTTLGSPGAADCAACVGILLEILRLHVAALPPPEAPLVFLFNGGEETFMQAAHGFVAHHPWSRDAGAVINVEATGSGGPDVLFREAGGWPAATYARAVPHPVTTATIRDLVRFANLPVDTDFSVFADPAERDGNLPGVDLASMLDGYSYPHRRRRRRSNPTRIRPGVRRERPRRVVRVRRRARATRRRGPRATRRADATGRGRRVFRRLRRRRRRRARSRRLRRRAHRAPRVVRRRRREKRTRATRELPRGG